MDMINNYCSKVYSKWCGKFKCFIKPNNNIYSKCMMTFMCSFTVIRFDVLLNIECR